MTTKIDELRALLAAATPGPWKNGDVVDTIDYDADGNEIEVNIGWPVPPAVVDMGDFETLRLADARLAAAAVNALPALLDLARLAKCEDYGQMANRDLWCCVDPKDADRREDWCDTCLALDALGMGAGKEDADG